jgi:hypothetical protein
MRAALRASAMVNRKFAFEKVSPAVADLQAATARPRPVWLKNTEINLLKSL